MICSHKGRFRRTPRVEADQVEPMRLANPDDPLPRIHIGWRMTGLGEDGALERAAEEGLAAVHQELSALGCDVAEAERDPFRFQWGLMFFHPRFGRVERPLE